MTVVEIPSGTHAGNRWLGRRLLGGRFRLDERISLDDQVSGPCGFSWEARGFSLWKASDQLLGRPVTIYLLPPGVPVPRRVVEAVQSAAKVTDPRLAAVYDTDFNPECPYIVSEWAPGTPLEDLVLTGLPHPALAAAMIADAADALAVAHQAGLPHLRLTPRSLRWDPGSGLKITGLGLDAALCGAAADNPVAADTTALGRMLYALLTGYWPGDEAQPSTGQPSTGQPRPPSPHCRRRPGIRAACARRGRSGPGCPPSWTPSPTARCTGRPRTPRCGRRLRPGWPWRFAWCSGRPTRWKGRRRRARRSGRSGASPDGTRGTPGPASGTGSRCCAPRYDAGPYPGVSRVRTRSWPSASSSVGSRGPVSFPISSW